LTTLVLASHAASQVLALWVPEPYLLASFASRPARSDSNFLGDHRRPTRGIVLDHAGAFAALMAAPYERDHLLGAGSRHRRDPIRGRQ